MADVDPAIILIDQMKEIYIDGELDPVETANWFPKIARKDYMVGANLSGSGVDDPDAYFFEHYACGSERKLHQLPATQSSRRCTSSSPSSPTKQNARWPARYRCLLRKGRATGEPDPWPFSPHAPGQTGRNLGGGHSKRPPSLMVALSR